MTNPGRGEVKNGKGIGLAKALTLREASVDAACPPVHAEDAKKAPGHMNAEGDGNHSTCVPFLVCASWGVLSPPFFPLDHVFGCRCSEVLDECCGKHTNWLHRERAGSTHEARHSSPRPASICTAHVLGPRHRAGCWGGRWSLLLWSRLERDQRLLREDPCVEGSWIGGGEGSRLLCSGGSLGESGTL